MGQPEMPLYSNRTGAVYEGDPKPLLSQQIASPVRWETIVRNMIAAGADTFVELGPGKTLCGLIEKIDKTVKTYALSSQADLETILKEVKGCLTERRRWSPVVPGASAPGHCEKAGLPGGQRGGGLCR